MKTLKLGTAVLLTLLVVAFPIQGFQFEESKEGDHFKIFYHKGYDQQADRLLKAHEDCYAMVTDFIGYQPPSKTDIYLCATPDEIIDFGYPTKPTVDDSCGQFYRGVLSYYNPKELLQAEGSLATHEVTHAIERQFLSFHCPFWWTEGLACYLSYLARNMTGRPSPGGLYDNQLQLLSDSILRNNPPFRTLQDLISPPADALSYITSTTVFLYLDENYKQSKIKELMSSAKNAQDIYRALNTTLAKGFDEFQAEWKNCLTGVVKGIADAQTAVEAAELEHRTHGLYDAKAELSEAINAFNVGRYREATVKANEAMGLAQSSTEPTARFEFSNLTISPKEGTVGEPVNISADIRNTGEAQGETIVTLRVNGLLVENRTVNLAAAYGQTIVFSVTEKNEGTYQVNIAELNGTFTIKHVSQYPTPLLLTIPALIIIVYLLVRRMKRKKAN
jgi:hypothetical protein